MNREVLEKFIQSIYPMPEEKQKELALKFKYNELKKGDFLFKEGSVFNATYFLENGYVRSFTYNNKEDEVTTNIFSGPCFVSDFLSLFKQQPTKENFQALTNCKIWQMPFNDVQFCFHTVPEFREFGRLLLVTNYGILQERVIGMIKDTAETRYLKLLKEHNDVFRNVPLKIIASYLGITDTSLSRIRKELTQK